MKVLRWLACILLLLPHLTASAHVGSKDVFEEAKAGPYQLFVTVRPPVVIPGVAAVEVRVSGQPVQTLALTQLPLTGEASHHAPPPDVMKRSAIDPHFYTGSVWMMQAGSMQVRFDVTGAAGAYQAAVPVPALPISTLKMHRTLGLLLSISGIILILGMGGIIGAAVREGRLKPGAAPTADLRRRGLFAGAATVLVLFGLVWLGGKWWNVEAANFAGTIYKPLVTTPILEGNQLKLLVSANNSERTDQVRSNNDFILDHGKVMHLYVVREPELDAVYHLHPDFGGGGNFHLTLPKMPPGEYRLYGDVVHANGFPETVVTTVHIPAGMQGSRLGADDAEGAPAALSSGLLGPIYKLPDGYSMVWDKPATLTADTAYAFHFELRDPSGKAPAHMRTYLGMAGHAAFLKTDGTVFAHVHPEGSAAMAAMMIANNQGSTLASPTSSSEGSMSAMSDGMPGMSMSADSDLSSNAVEFPYGFPTPGRYRIFVQMKHDSVVETGTFDAMVK